MRLAFATLALTCLAATAAPTIGTVDITPKSFPLAVPSVVTITAVITDTSLIDGGANLQRIDSSGRVIATYGILHDDGKNGDAVAGDRIFTVQQSFTEGTVGPIQLRVAAAFKGVLTRVFSGLLTVNVSGTAAPKITILSPQNLAYLNTASTTVTGTVDIANATVKVNEVNAPLSGKNFSVALPLAEGPNIITVTAQAPGAPVASSSISVNLDTTPPRVTITSPPDQFQTADAAISVAGVVNDIVVGTVNQQQVGVTVNGQAAQVSNRTFGINSVPLAAGSNTITAIGRDRAGNTFTTAITVNRIIPPPVRLSLVSGNNQSGRISTALPQPLVVSLLQGTTPLANKQVIFKITQNNGQLTVGANPPASSVTATTDAQGRAQAVLTLGTRSGAGGNQVEAYAVGYDGSALFTETGVPANAALIVVDSGNAQTGEVNQKLAKPFIAVVTDAGFNRLANVPVTFTVKSGGGGIDGKAAITVNTDSDGRAAAVLTLGFQEGTASNQVEANFPGNTSYPAVFTATGKLTADPTKTSISGVVLDNSNNPLPGVTLRTVLTNQLTMNSSIVASAAVTTTDAQGQFKLQPAPVGFVKLMVDGSTTAKPGTYPSLDYDLVTVAGQNTTVGQPIYLLPIKEDNKLCLTPTTGGGTLTIPEAPGFSLTVKPGQVTFPGGSRTGCVSVTVVHSDKVPMVPGFGQQPRFVVTIQPAGALFNPPAPITLPNVDGLKPGAMTEMYSFDHDIGSFVAIGTGQVSDDGLIIRSSTGVGVLKAGWHCGGNPNPGGAAAYCGPCAYCDGVNCQPNAKQGNACENDCILGGRGTCVGGYCTGTFATRGTPCGAGSTGQCDGKGNCGFPCTGPNCTCTGPNCGSCGNCNSGNPCIDDSCNNGQCVSTPNAFCQNSCNGRGGQCTVGGIFGTCDSSGSCNTCATTGAGTSCVANGAIGVCSASNQCCVNSSCTDVLDIYSVLTSSANTPSGPLLVGPKNGSFVTNDSAGITVSGRVSGTPQLNSQIQWTALATNSATDLPYYTQQTGSSLTFFARSQLLDAGSPWLAPDDKRRAGHPSLAYGIDATVSYNTTSLQASLAPPLPLIYQDAADTLRQEYIDFNQYFDCRLAHPDLPCFEPTRSQIAIPTDSTLNQSPYPVIAVENGVFNLTTLLQQVQTAFSALFTAHRDVQITPVGTVCVPTPPAQFCVAVAQDTKAITTVGTCPGSANCPDGRDIGTLARGLLTQPIGDDYCGTDATGSYCIGNILTHAGKRVATAANNVQPPSLVVTSGYRNPQRQYDLSPNSTGGPTNSRHVRSRALDIEVPYIRLISPEFVRCIIEAAADSILLNNGNDAFTEDGPVTFVKCTNARGNHVHVQN